MRRSLPLLLLVLALAVAACGDDEQPASAPARTPAATAVDVIAAGIAKDLSTRPRIVKPAGPPPRRLVVRDIVKGDGGPAAAGEQVTVQYAGASWSTGQEFDASWNRAQPFAFPLGSGQVIPGWDRGVAGMRPGGRRLLVIPPALGYGPSGQPPVIKPNETLVFVVDLVRRS